jgi:hypothetical protein
MQSNKDCKMETGIDEPVQASNNAFLIAASLQIGSTASLTDVLPFLPHCFC